MKIALYFQILIFLSLWSCQDREFQNPFDPQVPKTLSILVSPREAGRINASPISSIYATDELVTLTPEANENWVFQNWEGDVSGNSVPMSLTMDSNKSVTAVFVRKNYSLIVTIQGEGTVSEAIVSSPSGREYPHGTTVRLTPVPKEGWVFESWSGDLTGTDAPKNITVDKEKNVVVKFMRPAIGALDCNSSTDNGILIAGRDAFDVSSSIPYSGGDGTSHTGQTVQSTGVTGLTATLAAGSFVNGSGTLTYTITGKPNQEGTASFALNIGDRTVSIR